MMSAPEVGARGPTGIGTAAQIEQQPAQSNESPEALQTTELAQFERLRGTLEQRGIILLANADDGYIARRGKLTRVLNSLDAVERFARLIGGAV